MKGLIAFSIIIIFVNCQYCVRNESMTLTPNSESPYIQERLFHNDVMLKCWYRRRNLSEESSELTKGG